MKKIISLVMAGAIMLSLSSCSAGSKPSETVTETTQATTTKATTTTTTEETTTEETTTESSAEPEVNFDDMIPKEGEIFVDFKDKRYEDIADGMLKALWLRTGTNAADYAARFSKKPSYSYSNGVWTFDWTKKKQKSKKKQKNKNTQQYDVFGQIKIKANKDGDKIVLDEKSSISFKVYIKDLDIGRAVYYMIKRGISRNGMSDAYLKDGLAITPKRCYNRYSITEKYVGLVTYVGVEISVECSVMPAGAE